LINLTTCSPRIVHNILFFTLQAYSLANTSVFGWVTRSLPWGTLLTCVCPAFVLLLFVSAGVHSGQHQRLWQLHAQHPLGQAADLCIFCNLLTDWCFSCFWLCLQAYILANTSVSGKSTRSIPWGKLLSRKEVWAIIVCHFCHNWGTFILLTWMPTYYNQVCTCGMFGFVCLFASSYGACRQLFFWVCCTPGWCKGSQLSVCCLFIFCHNWGTFILLTSMPTYYNQVCACGMFGCV
jgi:hypothetical protein